MFGGKPERFIKLNRRAHVPDCTVYAISVQILCLKWFNGIFRGINFLVGGVKKLIVFVGYDKVSVFYI